MTNDIANAVSIPPEMVNHCAALADFTFYWGGWFIRVAFFAALAYLLIGIIGQAIAWFKALKDRLKDVEARSLVLDAGSLTALKGVLEALVNLPAWVAIFLAGFALLWMAQDPGKCAASNTQSAAEGQKQPAKQQGQQQTQQNAPQPRPPAH